MYRLVLAFGIICLLQGLSAEPKPGFALTNTVPGTDRITSVKVDIKGVVDGINTITVPTIASGYTGLIDTKTQLEKVITDFNTKAQSILSGYDTLVGAIDGDVQGRFDTYTGTIDAALNYISDDAPLITAALVQLTYTGISDELTDAFERISVGLGELKSKTIAVQVGIQAAFNSDNSATVSSDALRQHVPLRLMYDLLRTASYLRAYLPVVSYILKSTIENIKEADGYLVALVDLLNNGVSAESSKLDADIKEITDKITKLTVDGFSGADINGKETATGVLELINLKDATKYGDLKTAVTKLKVLFTVSTLSTQTSKMDTALEKIRTSMTSRIAQLQAGSDVITFPLFKQLVDTLLGNDEYGRYCYNKYKGLGKNLFAEVYDNAWECVDKEYERLENLKATLEAIIELITYDYEEVKEETSTCDKLTPTANLNICIDALATFYTDLYTATTDKIAVVYQYATDEAGASENRLLMCIELAYIKTTVVEPEKISSDLQKCSLAGPAGTEE